MRGLITALILVGLSVPMSAGLLSTGTAAGSAGVAKVRPQSSALQGGRCSSARAKSRSRTASLVFVVEAGGEAGQKKGQLLLPPVVLHQRGRLGETPSPHPPPDQ